jgi:Cu-Zn family superoxide dismutase
MHIRQASKFAATGVAGAFLVLESAVAFAGGGRPLTATADIRLCSDPSVVIGSAMLREQKTDEGIKRVSVSMHVKGLARGKHAVHIHETASCEPCGSAGGHFDPGPFGMSNPDANHPFHSGDLVNIEARGARGVGNLQTVTTRVTLSDGPLTLFDEDGSAFIIHDNEDSYCPEGEVAGCAGGSRFACGIITAVD